MKRQVTLDTGPLVAFLNSRDRHHDWAVAQLEQIEAPLLTCEAVVSEACFLLGKWSKGAGAVFDLLKRRVMVISFCLADQIPQVSLLLKKYGDVPVSMATISR